jgi:acetyl esterase/lipase
LRRIGFVTLVASVAGSAIHCDRPAVPAAAPKTEVRVYKTTNGEALQAVIYRPGGAPPAGGRPAAVLLHGGGWFMGEPEWMAARGQRLAALGMVAVAVQYRLSDEKTITPLDAMADVRDAIRWVRRNADSLEIDPARLAALGVSAGGHLAVAAAVIDPDRPADGVSAAATAFVLWYPALSLAGDKWLERILLGRAPVSSIDPVEHVRPGLPPTLIFVGANDSLTPLAGQHEFCARMRREGGACSVRVYPGLGHLFMKNPWGEGDGPQDATAQADASRQAELFLDSLGYLMLPDSLRRRARK